MRTVLICHEEANLTYKGLSRWLASFSDLVGIVVLRETTQRGCRRIQREIERVGPIRFIDIIAFRLYYKVFLSRKDELWIRQALAYLCSLYPPLSENTSTLVTHSPNSPEAEDFIRRLAPDIMLARCKTLLKETIFSIPSRGTLVMHPGICPEYRNSHGCFWALANDDLGKVGMTLFKIDKGVDTGLVYGYYCYEFDELNESHIVIQHRSVLENLERLRTRIVEINNGQAVPLDTSGRPSATWGQPWLTTYLRWKSKAKRKRG